MTDEQTTLADDVTRIAAGLPNRDFTKIPSRGAPPSPPDIPAPPNLAVRRGEARRDAICAVALAIVRRGGHPINGWSPEDALAVEQIAEILIRLDQTS